MKKKQDDSFKYALYVLGVVALVMALVIFMRLSPAKVKHVNVEYLGSSRQTAADRGFSDAEFIRRSGVVNLEMKHMNEWQESAREGVATTGFFRLDEIKVLGKQTIALVIAARQPLFTVRTAGKYVQLDHEGYVLRISDSFGQGDPILTSGVVLRYLTIGSPAQPEDEGKFDYAKQVASAIAENGLGGVFKDINVKEQKKVVLNTYSGIPVTINLRYDALKSLDIAKAMLDSGINDGQIEVVGNYGYHIKDSDTTIWTRGM